MFITRKECIFVCNWCKVVDALEICILKGFFVRVLSWIFKSTSISIWLWQLISLSSSLDVACHFLTYQLVCVMMMLMAEKISLPPATLNQYLWCESLEFIFLNLTFVEIVRFDWLGRVMVQFYGWQQLTKCKLTKCISCVKANSILFRTSTTWGSWVRNLLRFHEKWGKWQQISFLVYNLLILASKIISCSWCCRSAFSGTPYSRSSTFHWELLAQTQVAATVTTQFCTSSRRCSIKHQMWCCCYR